jgi:hypothetical protein
MTWNYIMTMNIEGRGVYVLRNQSANHYAAALEQPNH